jgi:hypothetical protein
VHEVGLVNGIVEAIRRRAGDRHVARFESATPAVAAPAAV